MYLRPLKSSDYEPISSVVDEWWGGRPVRQLLPRLFFEHFSPTSLALVDGEEIQAFLVGLRSQSDPEVAYIHFVGVSPQCRGKGYGRLLYSRFFEIVMSIGCSEVHCITSPVNGDSIAFHQRMGFRIVNADGEQDGIPVTRDHAGEGKHRVQFRKVLDKAVGV